MSAVVLVKLLFGVAGIALMVFLEASGDGSRRRVVSRWWYKPVRSPLEVAVWIALYLAAMVAAGFAFIGWK